jgi:hypothetical protein
MLFDKRGYWTGVIGMPGREKWLSRYPQLDARVGFILAFRPVSAAEVRQLLPYKRTSSGVVREEGVVDEEALAAIMRITGEFLTAP